jgi:hypothetical protein
MLVYFQSPPSVCLFVHVPILYCSLCVDCGVVNKLLILSHWNSNYFILILRYFYTSSIKVMVFEPRARIHLRENLYLPLSSLIVPTGLTSCPTWGSNSHDLLMTQKYLKISMKEKVRKV